MVDDDGGAFQSMRSHFIDAYIGDAIAGNSGGQFNTSTEPNGAGDYESGKHTYQDLHSNESSYVRQPSPSSGDGDENSERQYVDLDAQSNDVRVPSPVGGGDNGDPDLDDDVRDVQTPSPSTIQKLLGLAKKKILSPDEIIEVMKAAGKLFFTFLSISLIISGRAVRVVMGRKNEAD
jgi:hypothetical protein